jgi:hypothetical protein
MKACIWYFVCDYSKVWKTTITWFYITPDDGKQFYEEDPISYTFLVVLYNSVIMLKGNELGPRTGPELVFGTFTLLIDLMIAANIFA